MDDAHFLAAFEAATLPRAEWTHEAHVRMAYLCMRDRGGYPAAEPWVRERIRCYNATHGNLAGYHETITVAYLRLIAERLAAGPAGETWEAFRAAHPDLLQFRPLLRRHYSEALLFSDAARAAFIEPDLHPLPAV